MTMRLAIAVAQAACDAIHAQIEVGSANPTAKLEVRSGTRPSDPSIAPTNGNILANFSTLPAPVFPPSVAITNAAQATANVVTDVIAVNNGAATWFRVYNKDGVAVQDGTVTDTSGAGDMKVENVNVVAGVAVKIVSWTGTMPQGAAT